MLKFFWNTNKPVETWFGNYHLKNSKEWIELILKKVKFTEIFNLDDLEINDKIIIVDSKIDNKESFYLELSKKCKEIYLFHLGDESALENLSLIIHLTKNI